MKNLYPILITVSCIAAGCTNDSTEKKTAEPETGTSTLVEATQTCYLGYSGRDSVTLSLNRNGETITGNLRYNFFEKDKSSGPISGRMHGDTLFADYTFQSEGTQSIRQVAFLKRENGFTEGCGDMIEKEGKQVFKKTTDLQFGQAFNLKETPCP